MTTAILARSVVVSLVEDTRGRGLGRKLTPAPVRALVAYLSGLEHALQRVEQAATADQDGVEGITLGDIGNRVSRARADPTQFRLPSAVYAALLATRGAVT